MATTFLLGVVMETWMGLGLTMCGTLFLLEGAGVGGKGVGEGVGAPVWLMVTGIMKSYEATYNTRERAKRNDNINYCSWLSH